MLGPYITDWHDHGIVPVKAKIIAVSMMSMSLLWLAVFSPAKPWVVAIVAITLASVAVWLVSRPSTPSGDH